VTDRPEVAAKIIERLRTICAALPETVEQEAWLGTRWRIRTRTFAHVLVVEDGWPPAYARIIGTDGPATALTFRTSDPEFYASAGAGYFSPPWFPDIAGMILGRRIDWDEVAEAVTESYCRLAPRKLAARVDLR
jgi:hypothetical protein